MAKLTKEEAEQLKALTEKAKAPDAPQVARTLNVTIDLGDPDQVSRAQKLGLLDADELDDGDGDEEEEEEPPKRRGFFPDE